MKPALTLALLVPLLATAQPSWPACNPSAVLWSDCHGRWVDPQGGQYVGEFKEGWRHGEGIEYRADGSVNRSGRWQAGDLLAPYPISVARFPFRQSSGIAPTITVSTARPPDQPVRITPSPAPAPPVRVAPSLDFKTCEPPEYTTKARRAEASGHVVISFTVETDGRVTEAKIEQSSGPTPGHQSLDEASLKAVSACTGRPGTVDGQAERMRGQIGFTFSLR